MTNNINYTNIMNVDDATSFDRIFWLVEERGLSLEMIQAELGLERAQEYCETRLAELKEKGERAHDLYTRRYERENKMKYWTFEPAWIEDFNDKWFEDNSYVCFWDYMYFRKLYKETKEVLTQLVEELEEKVRFEEYVHCGNYGDQEEVVDLGFNEIHWEGARRNGFRILCEIKYSMHLGTMDDDLHTRYIQIVKKAISRREITSEYYHKSMAYLYKWAGLTKQMKEEIEKAQAKEKAIYSPVSDVLEDNAYLMSIEDAIDLKRDAERIAQTHHIAVKAAIEMLLEDYTEEGTFFAATGIEDTSDSAMDTLSMILS